MPPLHTSSSSSTSSSSITLLFIMGHETDADIRLKISDHPSGHANVKLSDNWDTTLFEPQFEPADPYATTLSPDPGPEKKLTLFALRLAVLEKAASGLGTLGFIWATVVLLGGFAITLETKDFWFITFILLIEGTRIFSRSHELEWQHQATWSFAEAGIYSFRLLQSTSRRFLRTFKFVSNNKDSRSSHREAPVRTRTWRPDAVPILPFSGWVFLSRNVSRMLYWLQLLSASACVSLSLMRIITQDYGPVNDDGKKNRKSALNIFYGLALAEALLFLAERGFWEWKVSYRRLLDEVNRECELGPSGLLSIRRFFYDAYSRCVNGSIFDGLKMDLVTFAEELLTSNSRDEQLIGIRILLKSASCPRFSDATLRKLGTTTPVIERLIEMLNWKNPAEQEIRRSAAEIVSKLAGKKQNALRLAGIAGAMESITSLLYPHHNQPSNEISHFNLLGLLILKKLARDHNNCGKIGNTRSLLIRIIDFTGGAAAKFSDPATEIQIKSVERALELLKMLASTSCHAGKSLRQEISDIVFAISNIRDILQHSENHLPIQKLAIEILTTLAMGDESRERIGGTGGVINELLRIFFRHPTAADPARSEAGEALAMLALDSEANCRRILKPVGVLDRLLEAMTNPMIRIHCCRILRNLCCYSKDTNSLSVLKIKTSAFPVVMNSFMKEETKLLEVSMGLAARILKLMEAEDVFKLMDVSVIAERLVGIMKRHSKPSIKVPRMRRFAMEMAIEMMTMDASCGRAFLEARMVEELERVEETTEELEEFHVFLGSVGVSRHRTGMVQLVEIARNLMCAG